ncbi:hypothetical protein GE21DRAFT_5139 [Neurospora crassa]|uniref:Uncharacterized protein n=1 Tax=Neurospora crassa (strain ATCC 24698 / 74-OR23-1A / CBS 708.71 / DSM 1257 / FGSC 987) TaxID=367110 RepID=U9W5I8_NEUCR|nr:hypothetical protein NCU16715 [Neurospora crassa OR74A]ESA43469.1 hypothetical protein NCU16715 [Neurospora crassa OR74A]KHE83092.1 hypothetical protein GE21DRAFT_5139 [Neurospora crassa]|eukprot:XP_011394076.1 hypothetical protein NCU16715 [Neurospora crassa OR74A]
MVSNENGGDKFKANAIPSCLVRYCTVQAPPTKPHVVQNKSRQSPEENRRDPSDFSNLHCTILRPVITSSSRHGRLCSGSNVCMTDRLTAAAAMALSSRIPRPQAFLASSKEVRDFTMTDPTISEPKPPNPSERTGQVREGSEDRQDRRTPSPEQSHPLPSVANHNQEKEQAKR